MDRLNAVDAAFLNQEGGSTHMHIGGVAIFEGPAPSREEFFDHIRSRLALVPRYRLKIATPPIGLGHQRWVDDPSFDLDYHVRQTGLPRPGDEEQLRRLTARAAAGPAKRTAGTGPDRARASRAGREVGRPVRLARARHPASAGPNGRPSEPAGRDDR